ncbi:MAG: hypothetical protein QG619_942 [Pseudomonadota bacterium]|nr:hypothetical protein [Pseudomonadota bacterium]
MIDHQTALVFCGLLAASIAMMIWGSIAFFRSF